MPKPYDEIVQGERLYVKFYARDTWKYYFTKPLVSVFNSDTEVVYSNFEQQIVSVSGQDTYSGYIPWDTSKVVPGEYELYIVNAPCRSDGTILSNWTTFDTPCIKTTFIIKAHNHQIVVDKGIPATCEYTGVTEGSHCSICGSVIKEQIIIPATGIHQFSEWITTLAANTSQNGVMKRTCNICGKTETKTIPKLQATTKIATKKIKGLPKTLKLRVKEEKQLKPVIVPLNRTDKFSYSTSNRKVATVSATGIVTAKKSGASKITVKSGKKKFVIIVRVTAPTATDMKNVPESLSLKKGKTYALKPKLLPSGAAGKISFKTSDKKVATVNAKGKIAAKKKGKVTISVTIGKVKKTCKITVK